jgi:Zn-dependent peptidase ImmA (M78 family)
VKSRFTKKVKIGYFTWTVHFQPLDGDDHGSTSTTKKKIFIDTDQSEQNIKETLLHELLHACFLDCPAFRLDYPNSDDREEDVIRHLSPALMQTLTDNKWILEYLYGRR